jgi:hypothetical protein
MTTLLRNQNQKFKIEIHFLFTVLFIQIKDAKAIFLVRPF